MNAPARAALVASCLAVALPALLGRPALVHAEDAQTKTAKKHYDKGDKLFNLRKYQDALEEYQKAFDAKPIPAFLFNIGQCYRNLGDVDSAIFSFKRFLKLDPEAPNRDQVQGLIDELETKQQEAESKRLQLDKPTLPEPVPPVIVVKPVVSETPFYKQWWFWTGIAVVGVAGSVGIFEATKSTTNPPMTSLGVNITFGK